MPVLLPAQLGGRRLRFKGVAGGSLYWAWRTALGGALHAGTIFACNNKTHPEGGCRDRCGRFGF